MHVFFGRFLGLHEETGLFENLQVHFFIPARSGLMPILYSQLHDFERALAIQN